MADVRVDLGTNAEKLIENLREIQRGLGGVNTEVKKVDKSVDELNTELLEQKDVIRDIQAEEKRLSGLQKKGVKDYSNELKRVRGDLNVAKKEQQKITDEIKRTVTEQKRSAKEANKGSKIFKKLGGAIAGAFAVASIIRFAKESVKLYNDQAQAEQRLLVALKGRKEVQEALIASAKTLQKRTLYSDEDIIAAQSLVAAFAKEEKQIKELTRVTLDFATAKGFDLKAAGELVGKTFASSTNSLTRYGIQVEGAAGSSERLTSIITNLDAAFEGQAEAASQTGAGSLLQFQNQIKDLKEILGGALLPIITTVTGSLKLLFDRDDLDDYIEGVDELEQKFQDLVPVSEIVGKNLQIGLEQSDQELLKALADLQKKYADEAAKAAEETQVEVKTISDLQDELKELRQNLLDTDVTQLQSINTQKIAIKQLEDRIKALTQLNEEKKKEIDLTKQSIEESLREIQAMQAGADFFAQIEADKQAALEESINTENEARMAGLAFFEQIEQDKRDAIEATTQFERQQAQARLEVASVLVNGLADVLKAAAGDNEKYANFVKAVNEAQIIANGALAIAQALVVANSPTADNVASGGIAGLIKFATISGVILSVISQSISNLKSAPVPQFAEGVIGLQGPGTEKSDSILARLSKNESVMTADETKKYKPVLEAIRNNEFDKHYFDKQSVISLASNYEKAKERGFADSIAASLDMLAGLDNHDDLFNIRSKLGNSNYWLRSIDSKLGRTSKREKR